MAPALEPEKPGAGVCEDQSVAAVWLGTSSEGRRITRGRKTVSRLGGKERKSRKKKGDGQDSFLPHPRGVGEAKMTLENHLSTKRKKRREGRNSYDNMARWSVKQQTKCSCGGKDLRAQGIYFRIKDVVVEYAKPEKSDERGNHLQAPEA